MKFRFALLAVLLLLPISAAADALHDGLAAEKNKDYKTALTIFRPLAEAGNANAQFELGWMYEFGKGVTQDYSLALSWFKKAAQQGQPRAEQDIGVMYAAGQGVKQDYEEAVFWEALSSRPAGAPWPSVGGAGGGGGDGLVAKLTPEQIAAVKKRLDAWKPATPAKAPQPDPSDGSRAAASKP